MKHRATQALAASLVTACCCLPLVGCAVGTPAETAAPIEQTSVHTLYIGTTSQHTKEPAMDVEQARSAVGELALRHACGYTLYTARGGWLDEGTSDVYEEDTLVVVLMGASDEDALALAREAAVLLDQKSVMVEYGQTRVEYCEE